MFDWDGYARFWISQSNRVSYRVLFYSSAEPEHMSTWGLYSATQEDELGQLYLSNVDFLKNGVPASIIAALVSFSRACRVTEVVSFPYLHP